MNWMLAVGCNGPAEGRVGDTSPDKDTALNGDMLAAMSNHKRLWCFKTHRFQASTRNKHRTGSEVQCTFCPLGSEIVVYNCKNYPFFVFRFGRDLATPGRLASIVVSSCRVGYFVVCYLCITCAFQLFMLLGKVLVHFLKLFGYGVLTTLIGVF